MKKNLTIAILITIAVAGLLFMTAITRPKSSVRGFLPTGFRKELLPDQSSVGATLFIKTCAQCHELPSPKIHTPQEWPPVVDRMLQRLHVRESQNSGSDVLFIPDKEEAEHIAGYLTFHGDDKKAPLLVDATPSAILYRERCSQCHLLPHPIQKTSDEWAATVDRMQELMRRAQKNPLTDQEKMTVIGYLKEKSGR